MIAMEVGSKVEKREGVCQLSTFRVDPSVISKFDFLSPLSKQKEYKLVNYHTDFLVEPPKGHHVLAWYEEGPVEALVSDNGLNLTIQFHIEKWCQEIKRIGHMR